MPDSAERDLIPRPGPCPVVICVDQQVDAEELASLVAEIKASGRQVLVATRPVSSHMTGRRASFMKKLSTRFHAEQVHWITLGKCAEDTFHTVSAVNGVASLVMLEPELIDKEPSHPGLGDVPKLLLCRKSKNRRAPKPAPPCKFLGNIIGPVEVKVLPPREDDEEEMPQVVLEFLDRAES